MRMIRLATVLLFVTKAAIADLSWMAGSWTGESRGPEVLRSATVARCFEFLRIEQQGDQIVYLSMPNGRSPASSRSRKSPVRDPAHDFPQAIGRTATTCALASRGRHRKTSSEEWRWSGELK